MSSVSLNSQLLEAIFKISRLMKENMSYNTEVTSLSLLQLQALIFLKKRQNAQMGEVAAQFKIEMPTATSLINKLCKIKLVERKEDKRDRRLVRIALTKEGEELFDKAMKERTKKIGDMLSYLSDNDKHEFLRILTLLSSRLEEQDEN